jgi:hypothetical protein
LRRGQKRIASAMVLLSFRGLPLRHFRENADGIVRLFLINLL